MMDRGRYDIIGKTKYWLIMSGTVIGIGIILMIYNTIDPNLNYGRHNPMKLGIDFTGGTVYKYVYDADSDRISDKRLLDVDIADYIEGLSRTAPLVQVGKSLEGKLVIQIRTDETIREAGKDKELAANVLSILQKYSPGAAQTEESIDYIGPVIGRELAYRAIWGLIIGTLLILAYTTLRMYFDFGVCVIIALVHDVFVMCGAMALTRLEIDSTFVASVLTVAGYSIEDTIVIFDRVRENLGLKKGMPFPDLVNLSLVQTLARSINTTLTTLLPLIALLAFGGPNIKNFAFSLLVGVTTGAYSSIFIASPILVIWRQKKKTKAIAAKELAFGAASAGGRGMAIRAPKVTAMVKEPTADESLEALEPEQEAEDLSAKETYGPGKGAHKMRKKKRKR